MNKFFIAKYHIMTFCQYLLGYISRANTFINSLSASFKLFMRVRIRCSSLTATRGCKIPARIRVTQTSAGFSGAGGLPACERMTRRRTGVYPLIVNMQECLCAGIRLRTGRREGGFLFSYVCLQRIYSVLAKANATENIFRFN